MELTKGANAPVPADRVKVTLSWSGTVDVDAAALLCTSGGKVRSDDDFIFYNQPQHRSDAVSHIGKILGATSTDALIVDLSRIESDVDKIVISGSVDSGNFGQLSTLVIAVNDAQTSAPLLQFNIPDATIETAMIAGELYRRNGAWKFRAVGQGYASGLRGVATDFGITVEGEDLTQDALAPAVAVQPQPSPTRPPAVIPQSYTHVPAPQNYSPPPPAYQQQYAQPPVPVHHNPYPQPPVPRHLDPYSQAAAPVPAYQPPAHVPDHQQYPNMDSEAPEEEVTLQPFPTDNPYLKRIFKMKEFGRAPGRAIQVYRERVIDPEEKMIAAFKSKHGQYKWGYLVLTSHALRWFQTLPTRDEDLWSWDDVGLNGSVVVCEGWQYQLKGFGAGRKFKALMLVLAQSEGWEKSHRT